jgi:hypothetical protein
MRHCFSSIWAVIDDDPESVFGVSFLTGNLANCDHQVAEEIAVIRFSKANPGDGLFGN